MCRNIKQLRPVIRIPKGMHTAGAADQPASAEEIKAAALQYIRKVSGYRVPSRANQAVFEHAVTQVAAATQTLLDGLAHPSR